MDQSSENPMALIDALSFMSPLQKDIYCYLLNSKPQTALNIAKGVRKKYAKDVNPDLHAMKKMNLLEYSLSEKVWDITAAAARDIGRKAEYGSTAETEPAVKRIQLTELQECIYAFLKSSKPSRAISIAKGVGKTRVKDVNPDLYKMKNVNLLNYNEQEKLWTINTGLTHTLSGSPTSSSENSATNQSYIDINGCKDFRRDSGIGVTSTNADDTEREEPNLTGPPAGECYLPGGSQMATPPQTIINNYYIDIKGCQNFIVGDRSQQITRYTESGEKDYEWRNSFPNGPGSSSDLLQRQMAVCRIGPLWKTEDGIVRCHRNPGGINIQQEYSDPDIAAQEEELQHDSALGHSQPSGEEDDGPVSAPRTSTPTPASCCKQTLNISVICDEFENGTLDEWSNSGEES